MVCWGHFRTDVTTWRTADSVVVVIAHVQKTTLPATEAVSFCLAKSRMIKRSKKNCRFYRVMKIKSMNKVLKTSQSLLCHFWEFLEYTFYISFYRLLGLYHASFKWKINSTLTWSVTELVLSTFLSLAHIQVHIVA